MGALPAPLQAAGNAYRASVFFYRKSHFGFRRLWPARVRINQLSRLSMIVTRPLHRSKLARNREGIFRGIKSEELSKTK